MLSMHNPPIVALKVLDPRLGFESSSFSKSLLRSFPSQRLAKTPNGPRLIPLSLPDRQRHHVDPIRLQMGPFQPIPLERDPARMSIPAVELDAE